MSASLAGSASRVACAANEAIARRARARGRQHADSSGSRARGRAPARPSSDRSCRSRSGAIDRRQLAAAISRSPAVIVTCASFSASANVEAATGGPDAGDVPKVGGAPGVAGGSRDAGGRRLVAAGDRRAHDAQRRGDQELSSGVHAHPPPPRSQSGVRVVSDPRLPHLPPVAWAKSAYKGPSCAVFGTYCTVRRNLRRPRGTLPAIPACRVPVQRRHRDVPPCAPRAWHW